MMGLCRLRGRAFAKWSMVSAAKFSLTNVDLVCKKRASSDSFEISSSRRMDDDLRMGKKVRSKSVSMSLTYDSGPV